MLKRLLIFVDKIAAIVINVSVQSENYNDYGKDKGEVWDYGELKRD